MKKITIVKDDYPAVDKKTVRATDYIINSKYSHLNFEVNNYIDNPDYLSVDYYVNLMSKARGHYKKDNHINNTKKYYENRLAILVDDNEKNPPSGQETLLKMKEIAKQFNFQVDIVDYKKLKDSYFMYDALFIRETTAVNHHTYIITKKCEESGMVVIDDSDSIVTCTNKIYQNELFKINKIPTPKTTIICKQNLLKTYLTIDYPCIMKAPDSCCSLGVFKIKDSSEFFTKSMQLLNEEHSFLLVQEYYPTEFDWRIGVLNNKILFACKYWMSRNGWQIIDHSDPNDDRLSKCGQTETVSLEHVPAIVIETALKTSALIGNGLYGVDIKEKGRSCVVIEINDCIDIDIPYEIKENDDSVLIEIFKTFRERVDIKKATI